jgi:hypothetical protein
MLRFTAYCCLLSTSSVLATGATPDIAGASPQVFQGGAVAVLCWAVWYLLARSQPRLQNAILESHKAHIDAQAKARDDFKESLRAVVDAVQRER